MAAFRVRPRVPRPVRGRLALFRALGSQATTGSVTLASPTGDLHAIGHQATTGLVVAGGVLGAVGKQATTAKVTPTLLCRGRQATTGRAGAGGLIAWGRQGTRSLVTPAILALGKQVTRGSVALGGGLNFANGYAARALVEIAPQPDLSGTLANAVLRLTADVLAATQLKTVANGGAVRSASGFDVRLEPYGAAVGATKLDHQFVTAYSGSAGAVDLRFRAPSWDVTTPFRLWLYAGKAGLSATEENPTGLWQGATLPARLDTGADLSGGSRALPPSADVTATTLAGMPAGNFGAASYCRRTAGDPTYAENIGSGEFTSELVFQLTSAPGATDSGNLERIGGVPASVQRNARFSSWIDGGGRINTGSNWADPVTFDQAGGNDSVQTAAGTVTTALVHFMGARKSGVLPVAYVNGAAVATTTLQGPASGIIHVQSLDEHSVGTGQGAQDTCLPGKYALYVLWPRQVSAAFAAMRYRSEIECRSVAGMGGFDAFGDANQSPVAVPWRTTNAGAQADYDVVPKAFDPDGDPITLTAVAASSHAGDTTSLTGGKARYTPQAGWSGGVAEVPFTLGDGRGKSSSSRLWLVVGGVVTPPGGEGIAPAFPASTATIKGPVAIGQVQATYDALTAAEIAGGVTILFTPGGTLSGGLRLNKNGVKGSGADDRHPQFPIIIRPGTLSGGRIVDPPGFPAGTIGGAVNASGDYNWLRGCTLKGGLNVPTGCTGFRLNRSFVTIGNVGDQGIALSLDWCEFTAITDEFVKHFPASGCRRPFTYRCYFHDQANLPGNVGTLESIGVSNPDDAVVCGALVYETLYGAPGTGGGYAGEGAEMKSSGNIVYRCSSQGSNSGDGQKTPRNIVRHGQDNMVLACWTSATGTQGCIGGRGPRHVYADCAAPNGGTIGPFEGNCTYAEWQRFVTLGQQQGKYPSGDDNIVCRVAGPYLGDSPAGTGTLPLRTILEDCTGTVGHAAGVTWTTRHNTTDYYTPNGLPSPTAKPARLWPTSKVGPGGVWSSGD